MKFGLSYNAGFYGTDPDQLREEISAFADRLRLR